MDGGIKAAHDCTTRLRDAARGAADDMDAPTIEEQVDHLLVADRAEHHAKLQGRGVDENSPIADGGAYHKNEGYDLRNQRDGETNARCHAAFSGLDREHTRHGVG